MSNTKLDTKHRLLKVSEQPVPATPATANGTLYLSSITGDLSIVKDTGAIVNLEEDNNTTDHTLLSNIGSTTHAQIDTHVGTGDIHVPHTTVLIQGSANSGLNVDAGTTAVDLTAGTKQLTLDINNLATAAAIDPATDLIAIYDSSATSTGNETIQNIIDSGLNTILTTRGDILTRDAVEPVRLQVGPTGNFLYSDGTDTSWSDTTKRLNITSKEVTISTSYTTSLQDNQILNIITTSGNDIINLPDATTLLDGWTVNIVNNETSTELLLVRIFDTTVLQVIGIGSSVSFALLDSSIQNGAWAVTGRSDHNIINVGVADTKFTSINAAIASITDNSLTNQYQIRVSPGNYVETTITMKPYVSIYSNTKTATNIIASDPTDIIFIAAPNTSLTNLTITGASGVNGIGIYIDGVIGFVMTSCLLNNCTTLVKVVSTVVSAPTYQCLFTDNNFNVTGTAGIWLDGTAITSDTLVKVVLKNNSYNGSTTGTTIPTILAEGPFVECNMLSEYFVGDGTNGVGTVIRDGVHVHITGAEYIGMNIGIDNQNVGAACNVALTGVTISESATSDLLISNTSTTGFITGAFDDTKSSILSTLFSALLLDSTNNNISLFGTLRIGYAQVDATNVTDAIINPSLGAYSGGGLTAGTGALEVDVESGIGYVELTDYNVTHTGKTIKRLEWTDATLIVSASATSYIYVDNTNTAISSLSRLDPEYRIFLGIVRTDATTREFISRNKLYALHNNYTVYNYVREILKNQYISGSITTANASRQISISSGAYYSEETRYVPSGLNSPATFYQYNHSASAWVFASATIVNNTQYDNGTGLTALTTSYFSKHSLYIIGDSVDERYMLVIGQTEFASLNDAVAGVLPNVPPWFNGVATIIASLIMQEGVTTVNTILDERPFLGSTGATGSAGISDHGNLTGLGDDHHTQYLLVNGSRAMGGNLNMGTNAITNVGLVDGVDVSAHASRHLPNGADPITTAAPLSNVTISSTSAVGTANSLARSDHTHALTLSIDDITPTTTKGDIIVENATVATRLPVGTNNQILTADSTQANGMRWVSPTAATALTYLNVSATITTSTTAATYQVIDSMTTTPAAGTYIVTFSSSMGIDNKATSIDYAIFVAGVQELISHRFLDSGVSGSRNVSHTHRIVTVNGAQTVDVRWQITSNTATCYERSMILLRVL